MKYFDPDIRQRKITPPENRRGDFCVSIANQVNKFQFCEQFASISSRNYGRISRIWTFLSIFCTLYR